MREQELPSYSMKVKGNHGVYDSVDEWRKAEGGIILQQATRIKELEESIRKCLEENAHLADGEVCTLIDLKRVLRFT